jgi:hypothetical protein
VSVNRARLAHWTSPHGRNRRHATTDRKSRACRSARHGYSMLVVMNGDSTSNGMLCYPACATPWLMLASGSENARGRSTMKMQPWSGRSRA